MGVSAEGDVAHPQAAVKDPIRAFAAWFARLLQVAVVILENFIEWLGQEPERNWEVALFMRGIAVRTPSSDALVRHAQKYADRGEAEYALRLFIKVLETDPDRTDVLDASAELLAELGDVDGAKDLLLRSVELSPENGHTKYVLMGHLEHGAKAVECFQKGYDLLKAEEASLKNQIDTETKKSGGDASAPDPKSQLAMTQLRKQISSVLCAIAKVFLTDCFMEEHSLEQCDQLLDQALTYDPDNPEACQALADLRLTQDRRGESLLLIRRTVEVCHHLPDGLAPSYDFRTVTARLLVELSQYDTATEILKELSAEDDEDAEVLFLLGICHVISGRPEACSRVLGKAKELLAASGAGEETQLVRQIDALLTRRSVTEEEKRSFWNPRWWVEVQGGGGGGSATVAAPGDDDNGGADEGAAGASGGGGGDGGVEYDYVDGVGNDDSRSGAALDSPPMSPMSGVSSHYSGRPGPGPGTGSGAGSGPGARGARGGGGGGVGAAVGVAAKGGDERGLSNAPAPGAFELQLPGAAVPVKPALVNHDPQYKGSAGFAASEPPV